MNAGASSLSLFSIGDFVQVSSDLDQVQSSQRGHGEWADAMLSVSK